MECIAEIVKGYNHFSKALHLRYLSRFWLRPSLNKYSITCSVTLRYVLYEKYVGPCPLSQIQTYSGVFTSYSDIFSCIVVVYLDSSVTIAFSEPSHIQNPVIFRTRVIFRTLSRNILAYSERCEMLAFWEPFTIFRIFAYFGPELYSEPCLFRHIQAYSIMIVLIILAFFFWL